MSERICRAIDLAGDFSDPESHPAYRSFMDFTPDERVQLVRQHDALSSSSERKEFRMRRGISDVRMIRWRYKAGLSTDRRCPCGVQLSGRQRKCLECQSRASRLAWVKKAYGLSAEEYLALEAKAGGRCESCGSVPPTDGSASQQNLHVDHDHESGAVRGLLCHGCNLAAGYLKDDPARMRALAEYFSRGIVD